MDPILISIAAFIGVATLVGAVAFVMRDLGSTKVEDRLAVMTSCKPRDGESADITKEQMLSESLAGVVGMLGGLTDRFSRLSLLFEQANMPIRADIFFGISFGCAVVGLLLAWLGHAPVPLYPVVAMVTGSFPFIWMWWRRRSRFKKFARQLSDALDLIARALRSGHSLASGLHLVVEEMPQPVSSAFSDAFEEQNLGVPIETALKNMLRQMPNMDLKFFVTAVAIQRQSGGDMAEILDKISYIIRERFKIMGQVQALTGEGRLSGIVLMALPVALLIAVYYLNPQYIMLLFTDEMGRKMVGVAAFLQVLGAICIKKIVDIKI